MKEISSRFQKGEGLLCETSRRFVSSILRYDIISRAGGSIIRLPIDHIKLIITLPGPGQLWSPRARLLALEHLLTATHSTLQHSTLPVLSKNNGQGLGGELNTEQSRGALVLYCQSVYYAHLDLAYIHSSMPRPAILAHTKSL